MKLIKGHSNVKDINQTDVVQLFEEELNRFKEEQEAALGLNQTKNQWFDPVPRQFFVKDKDSTTILF